MEGLGTGTLLLLAVRGASGSGPQWPPATPGRRGLNLVQGDPWPPARHCEGAPFALLSLLGNCEGRRTATTTALACSVNYFFLTHIMLVVPQLFLHGVYEDLFDKIAVVTKKPWCPKLATEGLRGPN